MVAEGVRAPVGVVIVEEHGSQRNQELSRLLRAPRYFEDAAETNTMRCFNCGQVGHRATECTNATKEKPCYSCAQFGHDGRDCPNSKQDLSPHFNSLQLDIALSHTPCLSHSLSRPVLQVRQARAQVEGLPPGAAWRRHCLRGVHALRASGLRGSRDGRLVQVSAGIQQQTQGSYQGSEMPCHGSKSSGPCPCCVLHAGTGALGLSRFRPVSADPTLSLFLGICVACPCV